LTAIPLHRVATVIPFIDYLHQHGAPVEHELRRACLPLSAMDDPDCFVPSRNWWTFVANVSGHKGMEDLGFQVGLQSGANAADPGLARRLVRLPTLHQALERFCKIGSSEISRVALWLVPADNSTHRLHYRTSFGSDHPAYVHFQWYGLLATINTIRLFTGGRWQPREIGLATGETPGETIRGYFSNARFLSGQPDCFITLSNHILGKQPRLDEDDLLSIPRYSKIEPPDDFIGTLKLALHSYLRDGAPSVELAADIAGLSPRTLQRRLAREDLTYRQLLVETRYETAVELLQANTHSITEITSRLGYANATHFARAFRGIAGVNPRTYRQQWT
jgi:AraC-like DNA-binding protein